ncbi:MAG: TetR/AcrR family transcriptional regulator [Stappiaceae bacterium]
MSGEKQEQRRRQIEEAALELLAQKGYRSTSMLQIAKKASASNQTLYAWYGSKQALFKGIIDVNGKGVRQFLETSLRDHEDPLQALKSLGIHLLRFTTDSKAIIMNRAAIMDVSDTGLLSSAIDDIGRSHIFELICDLMDDLARAELFELDMGAEDAANSYIGLLFGEVQMRQALGAVGPLTEDDIRKKAERAFELTCRLYKKTG